MSGVRKKDQKPNKWTTLDAILDMVEHTMDVTNNTKLFTDEGLTMQIRHEARLIYHYCRTANEELDNRKQDEALERIRLQDKALKVCSDLKTDIMIAKRVFHLRASKQIAWTGYVNNVIPLIKSWNQSEKKRYKDVFGS